MVKGIVGDAEKLIEQQFQLLRSELTEEFDKARAAAVSLGAGAGLVAVGGILGTQMLVHLVHDRTRLPLWGCYGLVGGLLGAAGAGLLSAGVAEASAIRVIPPRTAETLKEDAASLREVVSHAGA